MQNLISLDHEHSPTHNPIMLLKLLPELQDRVVSFCSVDDLKSLSRTCRDYNKTLKKHLYHTVRITLPQTTTECQKLLTRGLKFTKVVRIVRDSMGGGNDVFPSPTRNDCNELDLAKLTSNERFDDPVFSVLCDTAKLLRSLSVDFALLTDTGFLHAQKLLRLEEMFLYHITTMTDAGLSCVATLQSLTKLHLESCPSVTNAAMCSVNKLPKLKDLGLYDMEITDQALAYISAIFSLERLCFSECYSITDEGILMISNMPALKFLRLHSCSLITDLSMYYTNNLPVLAELNVESCEISDHGCQHMMTLHAVEKLQLKRCANITEEGIYFITHMGALKSLELNRCFDCDSAMDGVMSHLANMQQLTELSLPYCEVSNHGLKLASMLDSLERLDISFCGGVTDVGLRHVSGMSNLSSLTISKYGEFTNKGLSCVQNMPFLYELTILEE